MTTVNEAAGAHANWLAMRRSAGTVEKYGRLLKPFLNEYGERRIDSLTAAEIELEYLSRYVAKSASTQRNHIAALRSLFSLAERFDMIQANPMRRIEQPAREEKFQGFLTPEQDAAVQDACVTPQERTLVYLLR